MSVVVQHPSHSSDITGERIVYATKKLNTNSICIVHSVFSLPLRSNEGIYRFIFRLTHIYFSIVCHVDISKTIYPS